MKQKMYLKPKIFLESLRMMIKICSKTSLSLSLKSRAARQKMAKAEEDQVCGQQLNKNKKLQLKLKIYLM